MKMCPRCKERERVGTNAYCKLCFNEYFRNRRQNPPKEGLLNRDGRILENEVWKVIPDVQFNSMYEASNYGRIRSYRLHGGNRRIQPIMILGGIHRSSKRGFIPYPYMLLRNNTGQKIFRKVGRLVLEAFVGERPDKFTVSHIDDNPFNSRLDNLCWESLADNQARRVGKKQSGTSLWSVGDIKTLVKNTHRSKGAIK